MQPADHAASDSSSTAIHGREGIINSSDAGTCLIATQYDTVVHGAIWAHVSSRQIWKA
ncbi:MAG: hypothetical protein JWP04_1565, partial [Belnapia sp.]|nr:hypothetical protein [Belnapia sp.]